MIIGLIIGFSGVEDLHFGGCLGTQDKGYNFTHLMVYHYVVGVLKPSSFIALWCVGINLFNGSSSPYRRCVPELLLPHGPLIEIP